MICREPVVSIFLPFSLDIAAVFADKPIQSPCLTKSFEPIFAKYVVRVMEKIALKEPIRVLRLVREQEHEI
jgi:hypothetical protein